MNIQQAMTETGMGYSTLVRHCAAGSFPAWKPRGDRGGWEIDEQGLRLWVLRRKMETGNAPARALAKRQLMEAL